MNTFEIGLVVALFTLAAGIIVAVISFFLKRLISSVDEIKDAIKAFPVELEKRPTWDGVKELCTEISENTTVKHERDLHSGQPPAVEEFGQIRRT